MTATNATTLLQRQPRGKKQVYKADSVGVEQLATKTWRGIHIPYTCKSLCKHRETVTRKLAMTNDTDNNNENPTEKTATTPTTTAATRAAGTKNNSSSNNNSSNSNSNRDNVQCGRSPQLAGNTADHTKRPWSQSSSHQH